jgi:hypothetical protein
MDSERKRDRLRSFALGSVVGASAVLAAARRRRPRAGGRETPLGLAAFEQAPCYLELVAQEQEPPSAPASGRRSPEPPASPSAG